MTSILRRDAEVAAKLRQFRQAQPGQLITVAHQRHPAVPKTDMAGRVIFDPSLLPKRSQPKFKMPRLLGWRK